MNTAPDLPIVLLVEGDLPTAELYRRELSSDWCVLVCLTESETQSAVTSERVAAAIVEPTVFGARGWEIVEHLVEQRVPVIVCSTLDERKKGLELGASRYLVKPVLARALLQALHDIR